MSLLFSSGFPLKSMFAAAAALPVGQQRAAFCADVASRLGTNPLFRIVTGTPPSHTVKYETTIAGSLTGTSAGITIPAQLVEPPSVNLAEALTGTSCAMVVRNASNASVYIWVPIRVGGGSSGGVTYLNASKALSGLAADTVRTSGLTLAPPLSLDVTGGGSGGGATTTFLQAAQTDMRRDPASGTFDYMGSYALNDSRLYLRTRLRASSQYTRAGLVMNRYPDPRAFTSTNPDYQTELSYVSSSAPERNHTLWTGLMWWSQIYLDEAFASQANKHAPGYQNNTRVLFWDAMVWIKRTNGTWERLIYVPNVDDGEAWYPDFTSGQTSSAPGYDARTELGGMSVRTTPPTGVASDGLYRIQHPYGGLRSWDAQNVAEVLSCCKTALVLHDPSGPDDRQYSRFLAACGADYYPTPQPGQLPYYYGIGTSRHKHVRAVYPAFQHHVMHTDTWAGIAASHPQVE